MMTSPRAVLVQQLDRAGDRAAGVDHVVGEDAGLAPDVADDAVGLHLVGHQRVAGLVDEGQRHAAQRVGPLLGDAHATGVGGDDDHVVVGVVLGDVAGQQVLRPHVVDRAVEEALDLVGVQVDGEDPVGAGGLEQVGDQPCRDRLAAAVLLVLAGVRDRTAGSR